MNTRKLSLIAAALMLFSLFAVSAMAQYGENGRNEGDCPYDEECPNDCDGICQYDRICLNDCDGTCQYDGECPNDCTGTGTHGPQNGRQ